MKYTGATARHGAVVIVVAVLAFLTVGCMSWRADQIEDLSSVAPEEVVLIGTITVDPPLDSSMFGSDDTFLDRFEILFTENKELLDGGTLSELTARDVFGTPRVGERFYFAVPNVTPVYATNVMIKEDRISGNVATHYEYSLGNFAISFPGDATFVYLGELRFTVSNYEPGAIEFESVSHISNYEEAKVAAEERFGQSIELIRAEVRAVAEADEGAGG